jgi:hypothetical protein
MWTIAAVRRDASMTALPQNNGLLFLRHAPWHPLIALFLIAGSAYGVSARAHFDHIIRNASNVRPLHGAHAMTPPAH